jgi:uncharacterized protein (TIGR02145 family)
MMNKNLWSEVVGIWEDSYWYYYTHEEALKAVPEGYHLPESRERVRVRDVLVRLGILKDDYDWETFSEVLKLPLAGDRYRASGFLSHQGPYAYYWASTPNGTNAYSLFFNSTDLYPQYGSNRADGFSVRCFQNSK